MAAIRISASFVLDPEQSVVKYSRYEASRDAESASASPSVNSKTFKSFTRTLATSPFGAPQQSLYFFPEPHWQGSLGPVLLLIRFLRARNCISSHDCCADFPSVEVYGVRTWGNYGRSAGSL